MQSTPATKRPAPAAERQEPASRADPARGEIPSGLQARIAVGVVVVFILMLVGLVFLRGDQNWDRLIYLLSGFEAIVFAAAGLLFGTTISRRSSIEAREDADQAKAEAQRQQAVAEQHIEGNLAGEALAKAVLAKADAQRAAGRLDPDVLELALLAIDLSPDLSGVPDPHALRDALLNAYGQRRGDGEFLISND